MKKHFYSHLVEVESIHVELDALVLTHEEKQELIVLVHKSVHHSVMDTVLSHLKGADKKKFLSHVARDDHESIWKLLRETVADAEKKITAAYKALEKEFRADIRAAKKLKT